MLPLAKKEGGYKCEPRVSNIKGRRNSTAFNIKGDDNSTKQPTKATMPKLEAGKLCVLAGSDSDENYLK